jgi:uncharacterized protein (DUF2249 family)
MPERSGARTRELDVRQVPKPQRHPLIFDRFAALPPAGSFVLVDSHDPKHLRQKFDRPSRDLHLGLPRNRPRRVAHPNHQAH